MKNKSKNRRGGFVLIEALIAVLIVALGVLGLAKLQVLVVGSAGNSKNRSVAMSMARTQMESLRNAGVLQTDYNTLLTAGTTTQTVQKDGTSYSMVTAITQPTASLADRLVRVTVSWTDTANNTQTISLNSHIAWQDPAAARLTQNNLSTNLIAPTGAAIRGTGVWSPGQTVTLDPGNASNGYVTRLLNASGDTILRLNPGPNNTAQSFTVIYGRVLFDQTVHSGLPASSNVYVRLSSEGQCVFDNSTTNVTNNVLPANSTGNNVKYNYFTYRCYVGPGWYGNVGVEVINDNASPTVCVGDPAFSNDGTTVSPNAIESVTRSYRGFYAKVSGSSTTYISTGVAGSTVYGDNSADTATSTYTRGGAPIPSNYPLVYGSSPPAYFNQDFLISKITGQNTCGGQMQLISGGKTFTPNAGKYYCISPDNDTIDADQCPSIWPGLGSSCNMTITGSDLGSGSTVSCTTSDGSACSCSTTAGTSNYSCNATGGTGITATLSSTLTNWTSWANQTCLPSGSCVAPANTSTNAYRCNVSSCSSGMTVQSAPINWSGTWVTVGTYQNSNQCTNALSSYPNNYSTPIQYQCNNKNLQSQTGTISSSWNDTSPACVATSATLPTNTSSTQYQWSTSSCTSGTQQLQTRTNQNATTTCSRTTSTLLCSNVTGFNLDSNATGVTCTTQ